MKELGQQAGRPEKKLFYCRGNSSCGSNYYKKMVIQSVSCVSRGGLFICAALLFILCQSPLWANGKNAVFIEPYAALNEDGTGPGTSHSRAISDFGTLMENLSQEHHVNTVILNLDSTSYKWEFDQTMGDLYYPPERGFTKAEIREMVTYARNFGMEVFVALATITHQNSQGAGAFEGLSTVYAA